MNKEKGKLLIVDDERSNLRTLFNALKDEYEVTAADSGELALEEAHRIKPDIILLDIMMPDMDGHEVLRRLKESKETHGIPVIFITGLTSPQEEAAGLRMGAVDYITKPFGIDIVRARVGTHMKIVRQIRIIEGYCMLDALTDMPNRRRFDQYLEVEWARAARQESPIGLLMLDIDHFKNYNDTYGHPAGDVLLKSVAETLTAAAKRPSDLAARVGGEEFAFVLPDTDLDGAAAVGEEVRAAIEAMRIQNGPERIVTVSVGAHSIVPSEGDDPGVFIDACDKRLYNAKKSGRNRVAVE